MNHRALHEAAALPARKRRMPTRKHRQNQLSLLVSLSTIVMPLLFKVFDSNRTRSDETRADTAARASSVAIASHSDTSVAAGLTVDRPAQPAPPAATTIRPHKGSDCKFQADVRMSHAS